jgi:hypothetical protein
VRRRNSLLVLANRNRLRGLEKSPRAVGELLEIHLVLPLLPGADMGVAIEQHKPAGIKILAEVE